MERGYQLTGCVITLLGMVLSTSVQGALINRGGGLIYDDILDITWLQDANYAKTNGDDADGLMNWSQATSWTSNLSYYDSVRDVTYDDWHLPTVSPINGVSFNTVQSTDGSTDRGFTGSDGWVDTLGNPVSEMGHMYYVNLSNLGFCDPSLPWCTEQTGWGLANSGPFINIQEEVYWSGSEYDSSLVWKQSFNFGTQNRGDKVLNHYSWAVRSGDVAAVPIPPAAFLFMSGILGMLLTSRINSNRKAS